MKVLWYSLTFLAGATVGGLIVRELAIKRAEGAVTGISDAVFGKGSYLSQGTASFVDAFLRS